MGGAPCAVVAPTGDPARWSRYVRDVITWDWMLPLECHDAVLADQLVEYGKRQDEPPVLLYCSDQSMLFVSRHRARLADGFRFVVPEAGLVEAMADKALFRALANEKSLPVPTTMVLDTDLAAPPHDLVELGFPLILKPTVRDCTWVTAMGCDTKALRVETMDELLAFWPALAGLSGPAIAQQCIPGPETCVVSYHVYVDESGQVVGEFTGRKIRTTPAEYGHTSALTITDDAEVARLGREVCRAIDLRGVAKLDFKYAPDGRLYLLEINARFSLWVHPGARAGVNLPALVYADVSDRRRPACALTRVGLNWVHPKDLVAARQQGVWASEWLRWVWRTRPVKAVWRWDDPGPLMGMMAVRAKGKSRRSPVVID